MRVDVAAVRKNRSLTGAPWPGSLVAFFGILPDLFSLGIFTHPRGRFQTAFLYPLSDFAFDGFRWWLHPWFIRAYWAVIPLLWLAVVIWRRQAPKPDA